MIIDCSRSKMVVVVLNLKQLSVLWLLAAALGCSGNTTISIGTINLNYSAVGPGNLLPSFFFMAGQEGER